MFFSDEATEAIRQVRAQGHLARACNDEQIHVMRMESADRPTTGRWETICVMFYDKWLDGERVPASLDDLFPQIEIGGEDEDYGKSDCSN